MQTKQPAWSEATQNAAAENHALNDAIRGYVLAYALWHGQPQTARRLGAFRHTASRHTLWRCLERGHAGHSPLEAMTKAVGDTPDAVVAAAWAMTASRHIR